ncbi:MAG: DUF3368 domain-containing protein [Betaproteobacteria bacterium]|nr:DUF3368 domain-containing protein [Betaproteobacteria bacterium]
MLGVLLEAKRIGHLAALRPVIELLLAADYRLSQALVSVVLLRAGE